MKALCLAFRYVQVVFELFANALCLPRHVKRAQSCVLDVSESFQIGLRLLQYAPSRLRAPSSAALVSAMPLSLLMKVSGFGFGIVLWFHSKVYRQEALSLLRLRSGLWCGALVCMAGINLQGASCCRLGDITLEFWREFALVLDRLQDRLATIVEFAKVWKATIKVT